MLSLSRISVDSSLEVIVRAEKPLHAAIDKVTNNGRDPWTMTGWTTAGKSSKPTYMHDNASATVSIF